MGKSLQPPLPTLPLLHMIYYSSHQVVAAASPPPHNAAHHWSTLSSLSTHLASAVAVDQLQQLTTKRWCCQLLPPPLLSTAFFAINQDHLDGLSSPTTNPITATTSAASVDHPYQTILPPYVISHHCTTYLHHEWQRHQWVAMVILPPMVGWSTT
jgi:hypothetical protein